MAGDVLRDSVVLLMKAEGPNDSVVFTDKSFYPKTITANGQAKVATGVGRRGGCCVGGFGTSTNNYVGFPASWNWAFSSTNKFTIEFFVNITAYNAVGGRLLTSGSTFAGYNATTGIHWQIVTTSVGIYMEAWNGTSNQSCGGIAIPLNTWTHIAICYDGAGTFQGWKNGLLGWTTACTIANPSNMPTMMIGALPGESAGNTTQIFTGFIDELRITKGINRYTTPFAVPTAEFSESSADPYYANTSLMLSCDGVHGATALVDNSMTPKVFTPAGNASLSTISPKYGTAAITLDGTGDYYTTPGHADFNFGSGDFTVEFWVKTASAVSKALIDYWATSGSSWQLMTDASGRLTWCIAGYVKTGSVVISNGVWRHVAVCRAAGVMNFYVDGVVDGAAYSDSANYTSTTAYLAIGAQVTSRNPVYDLAASFDEIRITKGVARYTSNFIPVAINFNTQEVGSDQYFGLVKALCHFNGLSGSTTLVDSSPINNVVTAYGACKLTAAQGAFSYDPGSVASFDGVTPVDYLSLAQTGDFAFGNQDFTFECWFNTIAQTIYTDYAQVFYASTSGIYLGVRFSAQAELSTLTWTVLDQAWANLYGINGSSNLTLKDAWHHLAFVRKGGLCRCFLDGQRMTVASGTGSTGTPVTEWTDTTAIGSLTLNIGHTFKGYIDDFRVTSGYARYVDSFIPPQANLSLLDPSLDTTTKLLHISAEGDDLTTVVTDSSTYLRVISVAGNAKISTAQFKFGASSLYLDGTGDYIAMASRDDLKLKYDDFCVEAWIYTVDNNFTIMDYWQSAPGYWKWGVNAAGKMVWWQGTGIVLTGALSVNTGTWKHVAVSRMNGNLMMFVDGARDGQFYSFYDLSKSPSQLAIGGQVNTRDAAQDMVGYIDEVIITKGYAKYFQDFQAGAVVSGDVDPYLANVSLLVDGSSPGGKYLTIYDRSNNARQLGVAGQTKATMDKSRYGLPSIAFDGNGDYITTMESFPDLILNGDFTIECSVMLASTSQTASVLVAKGWPTIPCSSFLFHMPTNTNITLYMSSNGSTWDIASNIVMKAGPVANVWYNFAIVRSGNTYNLFEGGRIVATFTSALTPVADAAPVTIGGSDNAGACFNGWIDDVRITKGVARYSSRYIIRNTRFPGSTAGEIPVVYKSLSGYVKDVNGNPVGTVVRAYRRDTGALIGEVLSDKTTGIYTISTTYAGKCSIVFLPPTTGYGLNALVLDDMLPV